MLIIDLCSSVDIHGGGPPRRPADFNTMGLRCMMNDDDNATLFGRLQPGDDALHVDVIRHHRDDHLLLFI